MKAGELDRKFDNGEDISKHLDLSRMRRQGQKRINVDFPLASAAGIVPVWAYHAGQKPPFLAVGRLPH